MEVVHGIGSKRDVFDKIVILRRIGFNKIIEGLKFTQSFGLGAYLFIGISPDSSKESQFHHTEQEERTGKPSADHHPWNLCLITATLAIFMCIRQRYSITR